MVSAVTPNAIITPAQVRARVQRASGQSEEAIANAVNVATAMLESLTRRHLRERVYSTPVDLAVTVGASPFDTLIFGSAGDVAKVKVDMDISAPSGPTSFPSGSRIASISGLVAAITRPAASAGAVTLRFGSEPLYVDGDGSIEILVPESPIMDGVGGIFAVRSRAYDGTKTDLDLSAMYVDTEAAIVTLPYSVQPRGFRNIEIECRAGYRPPSYAQAGSIDWDEMVEISIAIAEVLFRDSLEILGRSTETTLGGDSKKIPDVELPARILQKIKRFEREVAGAV